MGLVRQVQTLGLYSREMEWDRQGQGDKKSDLKKKSFNKERKSMGCEQYPVEEIIIWALLSLLTYEKKCLWFQLISRFFN